MAKRIDKRITSYKVATTEEPKAQPTQDMHEGIPRPDILRGYTYKIKTPLSDHAIYITINDTILNEGTDQESRHVYEIFLNSKNMEYFQWIAALTRVISAVFRKGGDVHFLIDELKSIEDPKGGFYLKGGVWIASIPAYTGMVLERHLIRLEKGGK